MGQANAIHSPLRSTCMIGRNSKGYWVVQGSTFGGLFVSRAAALKFAMFENGTPHAAVMVPGTLELNMTQEV
jgi:hypothetical protein